MNAVVQIVTELDALRSEVDTLKRLQAEIAVKNTRLNALAMNEPAVAVQSNQ